MLKYLLLFTIHVLVPISIGVFIYLLFRPESLLVFQWLETVGLYELVMSVRAQMDIYESIPKWVVYSLPNGLWAYSFMFFMSIIWRGSKSLLKWFFILVVIGISLGSEMGQLFGFIPGTFCVVDLIFYSGGLGCGYFMGQISRKEGGNCYDKNKNFSFANLPRSLYLSSNRQR